jgi:alpha-beta hydrolase superfamily lysophospholipase
MKESSFESTGGVKIATRSWSAEGKPRAIMILVHGFNAHSGYMVWPGEQFSGKGFATYALDLRGRGKSEGERFYIESFSEYLADVDGLVKIAREENPGLPVYMLGHSAGGVIATSYVFDHQPEIAGLICESFAFDVWYSRRRVADPEGPQSSGSASACLHVEERNLLTRSRCSREDEQRSVDR